MVLYAELPGDAGPYLVVVGVVLLGGLDHEEVTQPAARGRVPRLRHRDEQRAHAVLLGVLLVPARPKMPVWFSSHGNVLQVRVSHTADMSALVGGMTG